ncbi:alpha/beta-hydrolase [Neolentinus lepideus HHB14362 ss-1]|uniref:Alpha/beta-hydrolase n=1 Tax=Neolentinus lepideus HHB14362 ss-1 TaxID=1314782 RepID=A0A165PIF1_9AGAM|nr:alpha/beta-hydrolase [Neolentinus lepideus HHB14362 ss-1]
MPMNTLTGKAGLKLGPLVLETLVKHYFEGLTKDKDGAEVVNLRKDELLYDQAFNIIKEFLDAASKHTVEELQSFSNTRTPSPPWVRVVRLLVPMSVCEEAAVYLIKALGGEDVAKRVVGGTKWWQVRGLKGVNCEWIVAKKDWEEAKKRYKTYEKTHQEKANGTPKEFGTDAPMNGAASGDGDDVYDPEMDAMRCILWFHGGGYYFGSVDQERYSIQRYARKINGRIFAVNYRLAPQYPFPCALHDALAAYLYLIQPPEGAAHMPVPPAHIVMGGDSAGGGLTLALLQVIRDSGLPMPAGAVLVSPWCDMTHSFPSIHTNTDTDVLPKYGLSFHKPSTLWPPPSEEVTTRVHETLRSRIRSVVRLDTNGNVRGTRKDDVADPKNLQTRSQMSENTVATYNIKDSSGKPVHVGSTTSLPIPGAPEGQTIKIETHSGETITIEEQIHLYTTNNLLPHPLVSPVLGYLGGLPPLFIIASDKEVLRDEIIYAAHKAANPERYPIKEETRHLYPVLDGIENCYGPTKVHLQVYDDAAHTLPTLFAFTTPAKYCYRAIAAFCKYATGILGDAPGSPDALEAVSFASQQAPPPRMDVIESGESYRFTRAASPEHIPTSSRRPHSSHGSPRGSRFSEQGSQSSRRPTKRRSLSVKIARATSGMRRRSTYGEQRVNEDGTAVEVLQSAPPDPGRKNGSADVAGPRFGVRSTSDRSTRTGNVRMAGDPSIYLDSAFSFQDNMIRERVSTHGAIRPLEPESDLPALQVPAQVIGNINELAVQRYLDGLRYFDEKFGHTKKSIAKVRKRNLERAKKDTIRNIAQLQMYLNQDEDTSDSKGKAKSESKSQERKGVKEGLMAASGSWSWAWALDTDEHPPPSSIVSRRDTEDARQLAKIADQSVLPEEKSLSGNNLWTVIVNFLTITPDRDAGKEKGKEKAEEGARGRESGEDEKRGRSISKSAWSKFRIAWSGHRQSASE